MPPRSKQRPAECTGHAWAALLLLPGEQGLRAAQQAVHRAVAGRLLGRVERLLEAPFR